MPLAFPCLLHTLRLRYARDDIFTAIGPVLIVVNPYKPVRVCSGETFACPSSCDGTTHFAERYQKRAQRCYKGSNGVDFWYLKCVPESGATEGRQISSTPPG